MTKAVPHRPSFLDRLHPCIFLALSNDTRWLTAISAFVAGYGPAAAVGGHAPTEHAASESTLVDEHIATYTQLPTTWSFERDGTLTSIAIRGRVRMSAAEGIREAVLADMGLSIASTWMFSPEPSEPRLLHLKL